MPSTATITAFYDFSANTKARAAQVNTNFSNFRGHIVAIDPNTQTASNETYDLGSTEYRWRTGYFREIDIKSNTSTGQALQIVGDTAAGSGSFNFHVGSTLPAQIGYNGFQGNLYGHLNKPFGFTTTGSSGQYMKVALPTTTSATFTAYIAGASITVTSIGRPIECSISMTPTTSSFLAIQQMTISGGFIPTTILKLFRNSILVDAVRVGYHPNTTSASNAFYIGRILLYDLSAPAGTSVYRLNYQCENANSYIYTEEAYFSAREI